MIGRVKALQCERLADKSSVRTNSLLLSGIRHKNDVILMTMERRDSLKRLIQAAAFLVASIGSGRQAKDSEYGEHYFTAWTPLGSKLMDQATTISVSNRVLSVVSADHQIWQSSRLRACSFVSSVFFHLLATQSRSVWISRSSSRACQDVSEHRRLG